MDREIFDREIPVDKWKEAITIWVKGAETSRVDLNILAGLLRRVFHTETEYVENQNEIYKCIIKALPDVERNAFHDEDVSLGRVKNNADAETRRRKANHTRVKQKVTIYYMRIKDKMFPAKKKSVKEKRDRDIADMDREVYDKSVEIEDDLTCSTRSSLNKQSKVFKNLKKVVYDEEWINSMVAENAIYKVCIFQVIFK